MLALLDEAAVCHVMCVRYDRTFFSVSILAGALFTTPFCRRQGPITMQARKHTQANTQHNGQEECFAPWARDEEEDVAKERKGGGGRKVQARSNVQQERGGEGRT